MRRLLFVPLLLSAVFVATACRAGGHDVGPQGTPSASAVATATPSAVSGTPAATDELAPQSMLQGLYIVDADGSGQPKQIVDFSTSDPHWTPDGGHLYFMGSDSTHPISQDPPDVYTYSLSDGQLRKLVETTGLHQTISPNLTMVAYQNILPGGGDWGTWTIRVANLDDPSSDRKVADGILAEWSPDSQFVSYYAPACGNMSLYVTTSSGSQQLAAPYSENYLFGWVGWLPGAPKLAYQKMLKTQSKLEPAGVFAFDVATSGTVDAPELSSIDKEPDFSPDGTMFVYAKAEEGWYLRRSGGTGETRIADYYGSTPQWSPEGDRMALVEGDTIRIYTVASGSSQIIDLHLGEVPRGMSFWGAEVSWSPDGTELAIAVHPGFPREFCD